MPAERQSKSKIRDVLRLCFAGKLSQRAIAASLGLSQGAVSGYLGAGRGQLGGSWRIARGCR
jgi:predicted transcriptional regulator